MAHDVFVSYASEDKATADALVANLEQHQIRCWSAPRDIPAGRVWGEAIIDAIDGARVMVLVFSGYANRSGHVMRELERAASKGVAILPLRIEDVAPSKSMDSSSAVLTGWMRLRLRSSSTWNNSRGTLRRYWTPRGMLLAPRRPLLGRRAPL